MSRPEQSFRDDLELERLEDEENLINTNISEDPDAPLPEPDEYNDDEVDEYTASPPRWLQNNTRLPRWLQNTGRVPRWLQNITDRPWRRRIMDSVRTPRWLQNRPNTSHPWLDRITIALRPRLTISYIVLSLFFLYILYCYLTWSPLLASKIPKPTGPWSAGAIEIEVPVADPRKVIDGTLKTGESPFELDTVLFTLYYPALKSSRSRKANHKWFPRPISLIAEGYATAAHWNNFFSRGLFTFALWGLASSIETQAKVDVDLIPTEVEDDLLKLPIIVFSHGDISRGTDYSAYCSELASRGIVVAAIDHRDGSSPASVVHLPGGNTKNVIHFRRDQLQPDEGEEAVTNDVYRFKKLAFRDAEIQEVVSILRRLNKGEGDDIFAQNYRNEGTKLADWSHRLDFSRFLIAGHSFGGTGALQALKGANDSAADWDNPAVAGISLDPGKDSGRLNNDINVPLLIVHSDSWSKAHTIFYGRPHFDTVKDLALSVLDRVGAAWFITSLKTSHPSITDAPLIEPLLLSWTTGATIKVKEGLREYVRATVLFLEYLKTGHREGLLDLGVTHEEYGVDSRTEEQKSSMKGDDTMKYWEVHVAPLETGAPDEKS